MWVCITDKPGDHRINASIEIRWKPVQDSKEAIGSCEIWRAPLEIAVEKPWIKTAQLFVLSPASGLLGMVFSAPWLYQQMKERGEKRRKKLVPAAPLDQLAEARENLRLIQDRKSQYVLKTDIPLQLIKEERRLLKHIEELEQRLEEMEQSKGSQSK